MKKLMASLFIILFITGNIYSQKLGTPTPIQQVINAMPAIQIPLIGKNLKFDLGGDYWIAKVNGNNFLAGDCIFEETGNGYILTLKTANVWSGAVEEFIDLLQKAGVPLGPAATPLRTAAKLAAKFAKWIPFKGAAIILEYKEGPPVNLSFVKMEKQDDSTQNRERKTRDGNILSEWGAWDKWVYIGGGMGLGNGVFPQGLIADFVFTRFFSIEIVPTIGIFFEGDTMLIMPVIGKLGWRFANIELSADIGYTPFLGFTVGGTFGLNQDSDASIFLKLIAMPFSNQYEQINSSLFFLFFGIKAGVGRR